LNFTEEAQQKMKKLKSEDEEGKIKFWEKVTKITYKEAKEDKQMEETDYIKP
jgi:hypothetical protein